MKLLSLPMLFVMYLLPAVYFADPVDKVSALIRQAKIHELSAMFATDVEITVEGNENIYSKAQAEIILEKFFNQNRPKTVKMLHKVNSNPSFMFGVLIVSTNNGAYRIAYTLKVSNGSLLLINMRIETEKVK